MIEMTRFDCEFQALIVHQFVDHMPRHRCGNGILAHDGPVTQQTDQSQLHEPAKCRFSGHQAIEPEQFRFVVIVMANEQSESDVDVSQTWLHQFASASRYSSEMRWRFQLKAEFCKLFVSPERVVAAPLQ